MSTNVRCVYPLARTPKKKRLLQSTTHLHPPHTHRSCKEKTEKCYHALHGSIAQASSSSDFLFGRNFCLFSGGATAKNNALPVPLSLQSTEPQTLALGHWSKSVNSSSSSNTCTKMSRTLLLLALLLPAGVDAFLSYHPGVVVGGTRDCFIPGSRYEEEQKDHVWVMLFDRLLL